MSLIGWNCRGLGRPNAIPDLKYLVRHFNSDLLFLSETLVSRNKIEDLRYLLGFDFCFSVDRSGRGGGLALFWRTSFSCQIVDYSNNHIYVDVNDVVHGMWRLTGYYRYPEGRRRRAAWDFLRQLSNQFAGPWCILGDFNDIMDASEKRGKNLRPKDILSLGSKVWEHHVRLKNVLIEPLPIIIGLISFLRLLWRILMPHLQITIPSF
jgi:hypothetical protein